MKFRSLEFSIIWIVSYRIRTDQIVLARTKAENCMPSLFPIFFSLGALVSWSPWFLKPAVNSNQKSFALDLATQVSDSRLNNCKVSDSHLKRNESLWLAEKNASLAVSQWPFATVICQYQCHLTSLNNVKVNSVWWLFYYVQWDGTCGMTTYLAGGNTEMIPMSCFLSMKICTRFVVVKHTVFKCCV